MSIATELNDLRLKAFRSNSEADKIAYFERLSLAFQRGELIPVSQNGVTHG